MRWTIGRRLWIGFGAMIAMTLLSGAFVWKQVGRMLEIQDRVIEQRIPAIWASEGLQSALYRSLAASRAYVLTGDAAAKAERAVAWTDVDAQLEALGDLVPHFTNPRDVEDFRQAASQLRDLRRALDEAEAVAHTPDDRPATRLLDETAEPLGAAMLEQLGAMIAAETVQPDVPGRKGLLVALADARATVAGAVGALRGFVASASPALGAELRRSLAANAGSAEAIGARARLLDPSQAAAFERYRALLGEFADAAQRAVALRSSDRWNRALAILTQQATPLAAQADAALTELVSGQSERIAGDTSDLGEEVSHVHRAVAISALLGALIGAAIAWLAARSVSRPAKALVGVANALAAGDLSRSVGVAGDDEMGELGRALAEATERMRAALRQIGESTVHLASSANELDSVSAQMSSTAEETSAQAGATAAAAEEVTRNVQTVATGAEEMTASVREIAKNATDAARVATAAVAAAEQSNERVRKLGQSSDEIGEVLKVITSIAEQTNLLALNATIEAARAGEAGKGFSVVANEVKELAKQTAQATEDISLRVGSIQSDTRDTVESIGEIARVIREVDDIASMIASAVEEQSATTNEIGQNVTEAAKATAEIAANATAVAQVAQSSSDGAHQTRAAAAALTRTSSELQALVQRFHLGEGAAG